MRSLDSICWCLSLLVVLSLSVVPLPCLAQTASPKSDFVWRGHIVDNNSKKGIPNVRLTCGTITLLTAEDGIFEAKELPQDSCDLKLELAGYTPSPGMERKVHLRKDLLRDPQEYSMVKLSKLYGRVELAERTPARNWRIILARKRYQYDGPSLVLEKEVRTNANGEYSFEMLTPASYLVLAVAEPPSELDPAVERYPVSTFYPSAPDATAAETVQIQPGLDVHNLDITVQYSRYYSVSGKLIGLPPDSQPNSFLKLILTNSYFRSAKNFGSLGYELRKTLGDVKFDSEGAFKIKGVPPGVYFLGAMGFRGSFFGSPFEVIDRDVEKVQVEFAPLNRLTISMKKDGDWTTKFGTVFLGLVTENHGFQNYPFTFKNESEKKSAEFEPGQYRLTPVLRPGEFYVKKLLVNGEEKNPRDFRLQGFGEALLEVLVSNRIASVLGTTNTDHGIVSFLPDPLDRFALELESQFADIESDGTFQYKGLRPGAWRICASELGRKEFHDNVLDPSFQQTMQGNCPVVTLAEEQKAQVSLKVIRLPQ